MIFIYICTIIHTCRYMCVSVYIYIYIHMIINVYMCIFIYAYVFIYSYLIYLCKKYQYKYICIYSCRILLFLFLTVPSQACRVSISFAQLIISGPLLSLKVHQSHTPCIASGFWLTGKVELRSTLKTHQYASMLIKDNGD